LEDEVIDAIVGKALTVTADEVTAVALLHPVPAYVTDTE
jgi:hypothetical protein